MNEENRRIVWKIRFAIDNCEAARNKLIDIGKEIQNRADNPQKTREYGKYLEEGKDPLATTIEKIKENLKEVEDIGKRLKPILTNFNDNFNKEFIFYDELKIAFLCIMKAIDALKQHGKFLQEKADNKNMIIELALGLQNLREDCSYNILSAKAALVKIKDCAERFGPIFEYIHLEFERDFVLGKTNPLLFDIDTIDRYIIHTEDDIKSLGKKISHWSDSIMSTSNNGEYLMEERDPCYKNIFSAMENLERLRDRGKRIRPLLVNLSAQFNRDFIFYEQLEIAVLCIVKARDGLKSYGKLMKDNARDQNRIREFGIGIQKQKGTCSINLRDAKTALKKVKYCSERLSHLLEKIDEEYKRDFRML